MKGLDTSLKIIWASLEKEKLLTSQQIREEVDILYPTILKRYFDGSRSDDEIKNLIVRYTEEQLATYISGNGVIIDNKQDEHVPWLESRRGAIEWTFWTRYITYLQDQKRWNKDTLHNLDVITDQVLGRLENPDRSGPWDRRGMIVGDIQSGKTANYIGLINKAIDSGYQIIIILAGMHNSLRSQTQIRVNEGILGFDAPPDALTNRAKTKKVGVGTLPGFKEHKVATLTSSDEKGDFSLRIAQQAMVYPGQIKLVLVVKKNSSVLKNLKDWLGSPWARDTKKGKIVENVPLLLIDDEADNASINTKDIYDENGNIDPEYDVTKINGLIRQILNMFEKSAYVGYTATPFANIFIDPDSETEKHGEDLFPKSFIISIPSPSNYIGAETIFGLYDDVDRGTTEVEGLPLIKRISDYEQFIPDKHKKDFKVNDLPPSLKKAIKFFILSTAARSFRGKENAHNSMLIHVTRYIDVQNKISGLVLKELKAIQQRLRHGEGDFPEKIMDEFKGIWDTDYKDVTKVIIQKTDDPVINPIPWEALQPYILPSAMKINVITANGSSNDILEYRRHEDEGLCAIVIGGDKLSRGLTLEGLTISYYLRASKMYDTLLQMGRWFGYRPGYLDLCRIFTSPELVDFYVHIARASRELKEELVYMSDRGLTPMDYGLRVRKHPDGLIITSLNKMRSGKDARISYSGTISESIVYHKDCNIIRENNSNYHSFIESLGKGIFPEGKKQYYSWSNISGEVVADLFREIKTHPDSLKADSSLIERYIRSRIKENELINWTVILLTGGDGREWNNIGGLCVKCMARRRLNRGDPTTDKITIKRLVSNPDEMLDLDKETREDIEQKARNKEQNTENKTGRKTERKTVSVGPFIRERRDKKNGLLLLYPLDLQEEGDIHLMKTIGFGVSFPISDSKIAIDYRVNKVYYDTELMT